jgi:large conductance mechanosensitive channel
MIFGQPDFSSIKLGSIMIGNFINAIISFLMVAFGVYFFIVVPINELKRRTEGPVVPGEPPADIKLLTEIRDLLKR